ncbi:MAG: hypothetical protein PHY45_17570 [Rhodocyclaceae bacterium]|nr:hypothetical protein [Rhodocyclaceae bacterium]
MASMGLKDWAFLIFLSLPPLFVLGSRRVQGSRKFLWFVVASLFSWLAYGVFLLMTRANNGAAAGDTPPGAA